MPCIHQQSEISSIYFFTFEMYERDSKGGGRIEKGDRTWSEMKGRGNGVHIEHRKVSFMENGFIP